MNHKKIISVILVASLLALGGGYVFFEPVKFGICESTYYTSYNFYNYYGHWGEGGNNRVWCNEFFGEGILLALLWSFLPLLLIPSALFFVRRETFLAWAKFASISFPLILSVLLYTYNNTPTEGGFGLAGLISDEMLATVFLPPLFVIVSLLIIGIKSWKLKTRSRIENVES